jgi:hypothetical protein
MLSFQGIASPCSVQARGGVKGQEIGSFLSCEYEVIRKNTMNDEYTLQVVRQTTITLPYLDDEVPVLYLTDGRPYIPVFAVCRALGIRADTHIPRWKHLLLWETALKLPFETEKRGKRFVWCLLISEIPFLYSMFDWKQLPAKRREELYRAVKAHMKLAGQAYQDMQNAYAKTRRLLFSLMTQCSQLDEAFWLALEQRAVSYQPAKQLAFRQLISRGRALCQELASHARKMLQDQGEALLVDGVMLDEAHRVIDTFSMPLFPIVPAEDLERLTDLIQQVAAWQQQVDRFDMWREQNNE